MSIFSPILCCLRQFRKDDRGIAATELAVILPVMVAFIFTSWELSMVYLVKKRTDHAATVLADLTTQSDVISNATYNGYVEAVEAVMYPFNDQTLKLHLIGVSVDSRSRVRLAWQRTTGGGTGLGVNALPAGLRVPNSFYVISETEVAYKPSFLSGITGTIDLKDSAIMVPRLTTSVASTN
ncbi:TadE/TadG family type IV pilus assembly protein [Cohaesibacter gelatinilyticus]|uniref:Flp pilus assembly protein TadG n=1 Tax=Cohaesibacter gelatinilyticus TaxID=372072 RepID=A0A285PG54_9HYPH|nr:TadE/TadG family type IV pilus assembly protein [Cohaesibacter gelatinilyticus]SNZ20705.1 Flp pilus assembly protein TadG [Cohaesibacter gelatinilyticus]HAT86031.1 pilus assembly protein [Hyphomicrobiales bacterium]